MTDEQLATRQGIGVICFLITLCLIGFAFNLGILIGIVMLVLATSWAVEGMFGYMHQYEDAQITKRVQAISAIGMILLPISFVLGIIPGVLSIIIALLAVMAGRLLSFSRQTSPE